VVLTLWAWLGQHNHFQQQILSCAIGTATVIVIGLVGRRLAGDRAGLLAAGIAAVYAELWVYERALLSEVLLLLGVSVTILLAYRFRDHPGPAGVAGLGAMCGVLAMIRSEQILVLPFLIFPLIVAVKGVGRRRRAAWLALATVTTLVVVSPWTIFNLGRFQRPVLLSNGFGAAAVTGNCNLAYYGPEIGYGDLRCLPLFVKGDQSVQDTEDAHTALKYAEAHLSRLPLVLVAREGRTFGFWNPFQQTTIDAQWMGTWVGVTRLGLISYWLLLVPAVAGGVALRRRRIALYPMLTFAAIAAIAVLPTIGDVRYRAAAEIPLVVLAAIAIDGVVPRRRSVPRPGIKPEPSTETL
jgi:4-amino-4-deoxy-L-arabinose transferase-like glycosyltransferase